jgi:hypothetical protein
MKRGAAAHLLQLRVFRLGFFQDGDVGVGVFPKREKVLIPGARFGGISLKGVSASEAKARQRSEYVVHYDPWVIKYLPEFNLRFVTLVCSDVGFAPQIDRLQRKSVNT